MTDLVALFLVIALSAYVLFGGADFGGGVLEATLPTPALRRRLESTLAPVWEANHVWLIAVVVILFVGFPRFYAHGFTRLFFPISLALLAVLLRGVSFTLRKYDPAPGPGLSLLYSALFRTSSLLAPLFFGMVVGGLLTVHPGGPTSLPSDKSATEIYLWPWLHPFGALVGAFVAMLFAYLAAVFFHGEVDTDADRELVFRRVLGFFAAAFVLGGLVLGAGALTGRVPLEQGAEPLQVGCQVVAALGIAALLRARARGSRWGMRFAAGAQVVAILVGWFGAQGRVLLRTTGGPLTLSDAAAPFVTQLWLVIGLVVVLAMVVPMLVWLYRVFDAPRRRALGIADDEH